MAEQTTLERRRYVAAFMRASNAIYGVDEGRPLLTKRLATRVLRARQIEAGRRSDEPFLEPRDAPS